jgi:hypothetical protein
LLSRAIKKSAGSVPRRLKQEALPFASQHLPPVVPPAVQLQLVALSGEQIDPVQNVFGVLQRKPFCRRLQLKDLAPLSVDLHAITLKLTPDEVDVQNVAPSKRIVTALNKTRT